MSDIMSKKEKKQRQEDFERFVALWRNERMRKWDRKLSYKAALSSFFNDTGRQFYLSYDLFIVKYNMMLNGDIPQSK